jgi:non-canonical purine NTP pyrophosphatase (RdgB/HAM1 family)
MVYFITSNKEKFEEAKRIIPSLEQLKMDLDEIQSINAEEIIKHKLNEAIGKNSGEFIVEDTSLYLDCLNGLPGPLIKWFLETMGNEGLFEICDKLGNYNVEAKTLVGYYGGGEIKFFSGTVKGKIVKPEKKEGFGWDLIFVPEGFNVPFVDLSREDKNEISMRGEAFRKLKEYLVKN